MRYKMGCWSSTYAHWFRLCASFYKPSYPRNTSYVEAGAIGCFVMMILDSEQTWSIQWIDIIMNSDSSDLVVSIGRLSASWDKFGMMHSEKVAS